MNTVHSNEGIIRKTIKAISRYIPQVEKPKKKISLTEKFVWCGIAVFAYLVMGQIPLYGVTDSPQFDFLAFARVIFAAQQGTIARTGNRSYCNCWVTYAVTKGVGYFKIKFQKSR